MLTLAINTSLNLDQIVLLEEKVCLAKDYFLSSKQTSDVFLEKINELLTKCDRRKNQIDRVFVISGPGSFTSLRIGVVIANALAYGLKIPIYSLNLFEFIHQAGGDLFDQLLLNAGKGEVFIFGTKNQELRTEIFDEVLNELQTDASSRIVLSLNDKQLGQLGSLGCVELIEFPFAEMLTKIDLESLEAKTIVEPEYMREAI